MSQQRTAVVIILLLALVTRSGRGFAQEQPESYPITLSADDVYELSDLNVQLNGLRLTSDRVTAVPIRTEVGITGVMLLGNGEFQYAPEDADEISGHFRGAMLRFNPDDQPRLISFNKTTAETDQAAYEMSRHLLNNVFRHCWHSGMDALIPDSGTLAANVYSREHGALLISTSETSTAVYNFTERKQLYATNWSPHTNATEQSDESARSKAG